MPPLFCTIPRAPLITDHARWQMHYETSMEGYRNESYARLYATLNCLAEQGQLLVYRRYRDSDTGCTISISDINKKLVATVSATLPEGPTEKKLIMYTKVTRDDPWHSERRIKLIVDQIPDLNEFCLESGECIPVQPPYQVVDVLINKNYVHDLFDVMDQK